MGDIHMNSITQNGPIDQGKQEATEQTNAARERLRLIAAANYGNNETETILARKAQLQETEKERKKQIAAFKIEEEYERRYNQSNNLPSRKVWTLEEMLQSFAYVADTDTVVALAAPHKRGFSLQAFKRMTANSVIPNGKKVELVADRWINDDRCIVCAGRVMEIGKPPYFTDDNGENQLNLWVDLPIPARTGADTALAWDHIRYLIPVESEFNDFVHFLAHMVQKPWDLPDIYFVHVSKKHGTGRGWLVWLIRKIIGRYARVTTLGRLLKDGFNAQLSGALMAMVEECAEGSRKDKFEREHRLRQVSNAKTRIIERKGIDEVEEHNYCRLFMMANDGDAIATGTEDRRAYVVSHSGPTKEEDMGQVEAEDYYRRLYNLLDDDDFIQQFYFELCTMDISAFNPHMRAPLTAAKLEMIEANKTEGQHLVDKLIDEWPSDIITNKDFISILTEDGNNRTAAASQVRHCWHGDDETPSIENLYRFKERHGRGRILRNPEKWLNASKKEREEEIERPWRQNGKDTPLKATAYEIWTKHLG
ncbi:TPA: primase-helicase family protein [Escherichia coli]